MKKALVVALCVIVLIAVSLAGSQIRSTAALAEEKPPAAKPDKAAVERTRQTTQLLDNVFKQTVVLITDKYVNDEDDFAAGSAAVLLFSNISKSTPHNVRLIDASGQPYEDKNVARDAFEKEGVKRLKAGAEVYEQIVEQDGKPHLRTLTPVPVVRQKCIMCHPHYADAKKGEPIGAISYTIPIE